MSSGTVVEGDGRIGADGAETLNRVLVVASCWVMAMRSGNMVLFQRESDRLEAAVDEMHAKFPHTKPGTEGLS